jgi:virginiamycin B lyase
LIDSCFATNPLERWEMLKSSTAALIAAAFSLVPFAAQAQTPGQSPALPPGEAKQMVEGICTQCHQTNMITGSSGYTREGWKELVGTMVDLSPNPDAQAEITQYLATNFPPNTKRAPKLVPGTAEISFTEWQMPTLGQRSRDPIQADDGSIWWAGQFGNLIGRLNPATGEMKEYKLPPNALPHSVWLDDKGIPWYSGNKNGTVGKVDPATGKVTEYKMPDPNAKDPHTAVFDKKGILWFTLQNSNMVGRLDPATGDIKLTTMTAPDSKPYGIKIDADGVPWFACNGRPCLVKIDPATMDLTEIKLPYPGTTVRRLDIAEDGMIWYVNSSKGQIGRYDPKTGEIREWPSPSGPNSHPYAIVVVDGIVWYNESGKRPDALVRFDPKTETFQSWAIPSGGIHAGIIRHMRATREGNLLIHQSSTNRIILVTVKRRAASR